MSTLEDQTVWQHAVTALRRFVDRLEPGAYREFSSWLLDEPHRADRWLQLNALRAQIDMTNKLLSGLLDADETEAVAAHIATYNVYLVQEVVSDNLAIGLAGRDHDDARSALVQGFNTAMITGLRDDGTREALRLLDELRPLTSGISLFEQSLDEAEHRALAASFAEAHPHIAPRAVEFDLHAALAAGVESCRAMTDSVSGLAVADLVRDGAAARYSAVTALLRDRPTDTARLLSLGTDSILVVPTLAYYGGLVAEIARPTPGFPAVVADGLLHDATAEAALAVRLLNDVGTGLLEHTPRQRELVLEGTLADCLLRAAATDSHLFTRLAKDIRFGEFNVCVDGIRDLPASRESVAAFEQRLAELGHAYRSCRIALRDKLNALTRCTGDDRLATMISRFVEFHRHLYANPYDTTLGEYGIGRGQR
ncbi:hypothetical protein GCM10022247_34030 [Allokutzneria multivorans]|uniref:Uncharacterized protein n=1 Tax=Allokutzneria multivorans TaxID=1142134 RepID=A0ABP7SAL0_9PSEU